MPKNQGWKIDNKTPLGHPGVILKEELIGERGLSNYQVSKETGINQTALGEIVKGR